jgi:hypothetical protein
MNVLIGLLQNCKQYNYRANRMDFHNEKNMRFLLLYQAITAFHYRNNKGHYIPIHSSGNEYFQKVIFLLFSVWIAVWL